jgi:hypothetical protein
MTDRELLELAAKAAGLPVYWGHASHKMLWHPIGSAHAKETGCEWNPLTDDGDALRLAVALGLVVNCSRPSAGAPYTQPAIWIDNTMSNAELTRRAIVRAAAEIGMDMKCSEETEANARLIAAAPDLLEALKSLMGMLDDEIRTSTDDELAYGLTDPQCPEHVKNELQCVIACRAAIAKATGETE